MSFYGRSKPYNNTKHCNRCGIEPDTRREHRSGYCVDCVKLARQLGWIE